jgi:hypothetical protein
LRSQKVHKPDQEEFALDYVVRFMAGGLVVSAFAILGDMLRPKSFAGLFGAAPSVALATLSLAIVENGSAFAAVEGRSMVTWRIRPFNFLLHCLSNVDAFSDFRCRSDGISAGYLDACGVWSQTNHYWIGRDR